MKALAPTVFDKFYVNQKFQEKDSLESYCSDAQMSDASMKSLADRSANMTGGSMSS